MLKNRYLRRIVASIVLILLVSLPSLIIAARAETSLILNDDFENATRQSYVTSGETVAISSSVPHHGNYSAKFTTNGDGGTERAYYYYNLPQGMGSVYVRAYFHVSVGLPLSDNNDRFMLIGLFGNGSAKASTGIMHVSGQDRFYQVSISSSNSSASKYPKVNQYYSIEFYWKKGNMGEMKIWVDGSLILSNGPVNTGEVGIDQVRLGLSFVNGITQKITVYADCLSINDKYIGTEESSNPAANITVSVDRSKIVGTDQFTVGFHMDNEWNEWRDTTSLRSLAASASFKMVRVWSVRMEPCSSWSESTKTGTFNWASVDLLMSRIFEVGAKPLICLGFYDWNREALIMPKGMATDPATGLPYASSYAAYAEDWVQHFKTVGLAVQYYQIVNEPHQYFGWNGADSAKLQNYVNLFKTVASKMRVANSNVKLSNDATMQRKVLDSFIKNGVTLDFLATSKYDADSGLSDQTIFSRAETMYIEASNSMYGVDLARQVYRNARGVTLPVFITEYNFNDQWETGTDPRNQEVIAVVWAALVVRTCVLKNVSAAFYATFASSKTSEIRKPSGGYGFGMVNLDDNKPWYPYYLQKLIGNNLGVGDPLVQVSSSSADVRPLSWIHNGKLTVLLIYKSSLQKTVALSGVQGQLNLQKIDSSISYLTPSVQTGTFSSGSTLLMKGYTVTLLREP